VQGVKKADLKAVSKSPRAGEVLQAVQGVAGEHSGGRMTAVILRRLDGSERGYDVEGLPSYIVFREVTGPIVVPAGFRFRCPPASAAMDRYGPAGRAWYAKHPEPTAPARAVRYLLSAMTEERMPIYVEQP